MFQVCPQVSSQLDVPGILFIHTEVPDWHPNQTPNHFIWLVLMQRSDGSALGLFWISELLNLF